MISSLLPIGIVFLIVFLFILLFRYLHNKGKNEKIAVQKELLANVISANKLHVSESESINNYLLTIDKINFILLYFNLNDPAVKPVIIDLWQIKTVKITTEDNSIYGQKKGKPVLIDKKVSRLQIQVTFTEDQGDTDLVLYDYKDALEDYIHIKKRADYWCQLISIAVAELNLSKKKETKLA